MTWPYTWQALGNVTAPVNEVFEKLLSIKGGRK